MDKLFLKNTFILQPRQI